MSEERTPEQVWEELDKEGSAETVSPEPEKQADAEPAQGQDERGALSPEERDLLRQIPDLVHLVKSTVGRVGSLQSELQKIGRAAASQAADAPTDKQISQASGNPEAWKRLKEDFPDWAEGVEALVASRVSSIPRQEVDLDKALEERLAKVKAEWQAEREREAEEEIAEERPDWKTVVTSKPFADWLMQQPAEYTKRALEAWKPRAVLKVLSDYENAKKPASRLATATIPKGSSKANIAKSVEDMSPEEYWNYLNEQERKSARA